MTREVKKSNPLLNKKKREGCGKEEERKRKIMLKYDGVVIGV